MTSRPSSHHTHHGLIRPRLGSYGSRDYLDRGTGERRSSQLAGANPKLQGLVDEWLVRERPTLEIEDAPSMFVLPENTTVSVLEIGGEKEGKIYTVMFPWMMATICCSPEVLLVDLKKELFERLRRMVHQDYSCSPVDYVFRFINGCGEMETVFNEEVALSKLDLPVPFPMLFLYEPDRMDNDKELDEKISHCLGYNIEILEESLDDELRQYRAWLFTNTKKSCSSRGTEGFDHYAFPEEAVLQLDHDCPHPLIAKIKSSNLYYKFYYRTREMEELDSEEGMLILTLAFHPEHTPRAIITALVHEIYDKDLVDPSDPEDEEFMLQLIGQKSFLTSNDNLLVCYKSVRSAFENYRIPSFIVRRKSLVMKDYPKPRSLHVPNYVRAQDRKIALDGLSISIESTSRRDTNDDDKVMSDFRPAAMLLHVSLWDLDANLLIRPLTLSNVIFTEPDAHLYVEFTVYCGRTLLVQKKSTNTSVTNPRWSDELTSFDLYMKDLPPSACLGIRVVMLKARRGETRRKNDETDIGWVNISLTDWRDELRQGQIGLNLWPPEKTANRSRIGENTAKIGISSRITIEIGFYGGRVKMPTCEQYTTFAKHQRNWGGSSDDVMEDYEPEDEDEEYKNLLSIINLHETGVKLSEEQQNTVWRWRRFISQQMPDSLIVISEMDMIWRGREHFSQLYVMLNSWKELSVGAALTLLGKRCTDRVLRKFAVEQLDSVLNCNTFPLFILPLIQALKYEPRAESDVACLLLRKALEDYRVGHKLFWLLRAEIAGLRDVEHKSEEFRRIALLMEAYLRGNEDHVSSVIKQVDMFELLTKLSVMVKSCTKDAATKRLREELISDRDKLQNMDSPLDPTYMLGELIIERCRVLGSAKMPLRLTWRNLNSLSGLHIPHYEIIFKNGDDLRQDMLVLQVLEVMDNIWKSKQLDCCLSPYPVLPMGTKIGIIGVVSNCATIFEIQSDGSKMETAVKSLETTFLNKFIRQHASDAKELVFPGTNQDRYLECVDRFLWSCVGYSVATYIMGIKDRHSDNIMMTYDGKLFHIDFGHILGHGKTKLGIQRDRQPFVLTEHFLCVMLKGKPVEKTAHEVVQFRELCTEAYALLWEQRNLFESLFTLMQGMELPELSTTSDLDHLKKTLCVGVDNREDAEKFFMGVFEEAFNGSWSTKTNWLFHAVKHL